MKKSGFLMVLIIILLAVIFTFSIKFKEEKQKENISSLGSYTTTEKITETTVKEDKKKLIAENKEADYQLYYDGENTYIVHGNIEKKFTTWGWSIEKETPTLYYIDADNDGNKELLIRMVTGIHYDDANEDQVKREMFRTYKIVIVREFINDMKQPDIAVYHCGDKVWQEPFESAIKCELVQLKSCKKFLQLAMNNANVRISYDKNTGITDNKYVGYASAYADNKKQYYTLKDWTKGFASYSVKDGKIYLDIQVIAEYQESKKTHYIGNINCQVAIIKNKVDIVPKTIKFIPLESTAVTDPRKTAKSSWNVTIHNTGITTSYDDREIDWIETEFDITKFNGTTDKSLDSYLSKIKCVDTIEFTEKQITLNAKTGFTFAQRIADKGAFSVNINSGKENQQDISYTCKVTNDDKGSRLTITFDKTYDKEKFDKVEIKFGV